MNQYEGLIAIWIAIAVTLSTLLLWRSAENARRNEGALLGLVKQSVESARSAFMVAQNTAQKQSRAYLTVEPIDGAVVRVGEKLAMTVLMKNRGQTPAKHCRIVANLNVRESPHSFGQKLNEGVDISLGFKSIIGSLGSGGSAMHVLQPGHELSVTHQGEASLAQRQFDLIKGGSSAVYCTGYVTYEDTFGEGHITRFHYEFLADAFASGKWRMTSDGNDAT